jgi:uncharacterized protein (TIGR03437 family)
METIMRTLTLALAASLLAWSQGTITTVAGKGSTLNADGGPASNALLGKSNGVAVDSAGNLYIGETSKGLRKVNAQGIISTVASGVGPFGLAVDGAGNVYFSENDLNVVEKVNPAGTVTRVAGTITAGYSGDGGPATKAWLQTPYGVAVDGAGNVYIADSENNRIRKVDPAGIISTVAGKGTRGFSGDGGPAVSAELYAPWGLAVDSAGNLFIADYQNGRVRKVNTAGIITTVAGNGSAACCSGDGGPATKATLPLVESVAVDNLGNLYIGQAGRVAEVNAAGIIHNIAGPGFSNDDNVPATTAFIADTPGIAVDNQGNVFIATGSQNMVRKVTFPAGPKVSNVVNGASFASGIVPNSWATILGTNLASVTDTWAKSIVNGKLPASLDGVTVTVGGKAAYLYYISSAQINLVVPDIGLGPQQVVVKNSAATSAAFTVTSSEFGPAFFAWPNNQVVATRQDFSWAVKNGTFAGATTVAAKPGDVIILWGTGFGPTNPAAPTGMQVPGDKTYSTTTLPAVTINNLPAKVFGAALAPGFAGLYQVAIQVPASLGAGDWPVIAAIGGVSSPAGAILSVQQ